MGRDQACAITSENGPGNPGSLYCWGGDASLTNNGVALNFSPTIRQADGRLPPPLGPPLAYDAGVLQVACGTQGTCVLDGNRHVFCSGVAFDAGGCGAGNSFDQPYPVDQRQLTGSAGTVVEQVTMGNRHACELTDGGDGGAVYCWGDGSQGQLGFPEGGWLLDGGFVLDGGPPGFYCNGNGSPVPGLPAPDSITAGDLDTCAVVNAPPSSRAGWCWGSDATHLLVDVLHGGKEQPAPGPYQQGHPGTSLGQAMVGDEGAFCGLVGSSSTQIWCYGDDSYGEIPLASWLSTPGACGGNSNGPECVSSFGNCPANFGDGGPTAAPQALAVGAGVCGLYAGQAWCWGEAIFPDPQPTTCAPTLMNFDGGIAQISMSSTQTCVIDTHGALWCWGTNLGLRTDGGVITVPVGVPSSP